MKKTVSLVLVLVLAVSAFVAHSEESPEERLYRNLFPAEEIDKIVDGVLKMLEKDYKTKAAMLAAIANIEDEYYDGFKAKYDELTDCLAMMEKHQNNSLAVMLEDDFLTTESGSAFSHFSNYMIMMLAFEKYMKMDTYKTTLDKCTRDTGAFIYWTDMFRLLLNDDGYIAMPEVLNTLKQIMEPYIRTE